MSSEFRPQPQPAPRYREVSIGHAPVAVTEEHGVLHMRSLEPLAELPARLLDRLVHWAQVRPEQTFIAARQAGADWRRVSYREMLDSVRAIAQGLLNYGLSADKPLALLSGNDIEHLQVALGAMYAGIPYCPVSPAYSLLSQDFAKLRHVCGLLQPGLVFVSDAAAYQRAIDAVLPAETPLISVRGHVPGRTQVSFASLLQTPGGAEADAAFQATGPDSIAKFLFTSGSTKLPKAVITTQRMLCANQQMLLQTFPVFGEEPPVLVDWLPWNHTAGGNHNFGIALTHGGTFHIDEGKPTPDGIDTTVRNLRDISPTFYSSVPRGYEALAQRMAHDPDLKASFFSRVKVLQYAGASLSQKVWDTLDGYAREVTGRPMLMVTGFGSTETAPFAFATTRLVDRSGHVGLPAPGLDVKLVPNDEKLELRLKGPNVTPGYWRDPERTAAAFDAEGYYMIGDALAYADPDDAAKGFLFDGRIAEDFKLSSGTWVDCAGIRARLMAVAGPIVRDVVLTGLDRPYLAALIFPDPGACGKLADGPAGTEHPVVRQAFQAALATMAASATGSSNRIVRAIVLADPPSIDAHEVTDKGSINARAVLKTRPQLVDDLYRDPPPDHVITA